MNHTTPRPSPNEELLPQAMTVQQALDAARAIGLDLLDAQLLLLFALGRSSRERAWLLAHDTDTILPDEQDQFLALAQRRTIGVPTAYLTGEKEFYGLPFAVDRRVLIPRPETELLVDWALELLTDKLSAADSKPAPHVLDLGTGSGILPVTLLHERPGINVTAIDASAEALTVAELNCSVLLPANAPIRLLHGEWFEPVTNERFNLIVSNPPYIAAGDTHLASLAHEPQEALVSGSDGLDAIRHIVALAPAHLLPGGWLLLEHGYDQGPAVRDLLQRAELNQVQTRADLAGLDRASGGQWQP